MSTQQVRIRSGLLTGQVTLDGSADRVFYTNSLESGDLDTGDNTASTKPAPGSFRAVKNCSTNPMYLGKTSGVTTANGHKLDPGESFVIAGPSGSGYVGDLFVIGTNLDILSYICW